jgi:GMP synthase (glutamine-hydrolysing)
MIAVIDFGSQYTQLIARRVRECGVYSEIFSCFADTNDIICKNPQGLIFSGGPGSVYEMSGQNFKQFFDFGIPALGICYGMHLIAKNCGGKVRKGGKSEYGRASIKTIASQLFTGLPRKFNVWMSHGDIVTKAPRGAKIIGTTDSALIAAFQFEEFYGLQFHPEVRHTQYGRKILNNFLATICKVRKDWSMNRFIVDEIERIRKTVGKDRVICAISGGIDSTVAAVLTNKAIKKNLVGIFVDNGLLRYNEKEEVRKNLSSRLNLRIISAQNRFLSKLSNVKNPEKKRKIIGREFIKLFESESKKIKGVKYLIQGTLYPDVIESGKGVGPSAVIKTHHNVGGLPSKMRLKVVEPLKMLFKDEVREIARVLKLPSQFIERKPFPGPGLAVRIVGQITRERLRILREADKILVEEASKLRMYKDIWQIFTILLPLGSVGVMGDKRTYDSVCAIRSVSSDDGMTADWVRLPQKFLSKVSRRITNEVRGVNRVVYDITSKPPATIEWE